MINIINEANTENYEKVIRKALKKAYKLTKTKSKKIINIIIVTNEKIQTLNKTFRDKDKPTDVLTFPSEYADELGDVFIAINIALSQAHEYHHSLERELGFLAVHGFLHAIGYDHETEEEANTMFALQEKILDQVKLTR
ncbi:MAG: rRNA maturation RNase YbeY [Candidatus Izemoplasmataceae bacterium]